MARLVTKIMRRSNNVKKVCLFITAFVLSLMMMGTSYPAPATEEADVPVTQKTEIGQASGINIKPEPANKIDVVEPALMAIIIKKDIESVAAMAEDAINTQQAAQDIPETEDTDVNMKTDAEEEEQPGGFVYSDKIPMSRELQEYTYKKCEERGLEYELVLAIMWRESRFTTDAVNVNANGTRDNGIMQINDVNRAWLKENLGIDDLMDPYQNIDAGTAMLKRLEEKYGTHKAMLAYQYGEAGMAKKVAGGITTSAATEKAYRQRDIYKEMISG